MEKFNVEFNGYEPKYIQIADNIKNLINSNIIKDGDKLPAIRNLSKILSVNNVTIVSCYDKLVSEGYAYQKMGSGTYAKKREINDYFKKEYSKAIKLIKNSCDENIIDFTGESSRYVNFPIDRFKKVINNVLNRDGADALINEEAFGYTKLRETINKVFWNNSLNIENLLIVSGAQQGIDIASKAIVNINDNVIVEKPTYMGALSVFKFRRANVFEIAIEKDGINIKKLEEVLKKNKIKCFYTMSYFQNPTGISYSREKKLAILELAKKYDFYIIEDDYLSELIFDDNIKHEPFKDLDKNDRVIYIKSFSKIFLPGIRLGYIISPEGFRESIQNSKINTDIATSTLMQRALEMYIKEGYWIEYINNLRIEYIKRYELMKKLINENLKEYVEFFDSKGGLSFYLNIRDKDIKSKELFYKLKEKGVFITPGTLFYKGANIGEQYFKLSFSQVSEKEIINGIEMIKEVFYRWHILQ
ncbi:PLP-dependent aminotransferase family protein [Clostridium sp.]|uniref:aminotransferase-like domain-containing protein n=2 Tax=Clostridium TaxID=1485 RepID=UPI0025C27DF1|nr:PLP-dependent aminotransferase family protein [Clostridium sp.]MCI9302720.1 PLP-dependent aminotransferase family protein [Clostridium sp.]